jgi:hypothetical protein
MSVFLRLGQWKISREKKMSETFRGMLLVMITSLSPDSGEAIVLQPGRHKGKKGCIHPMVRARLLAANDWWLGVQVKAYVTSKEGFNYAFTVRDVRMPSVSAIPNRDSIMVKIVRVERDFGFGDIVESGGREGLHTGERIFLSRKVCVLLNQEEIAAGSTVAMGLKCSPDDANTMWTASTVLLDCPANMIV